MGGVNGGGGFERGDRFLRPKVETYPVEVNQFTTMKELLQDCHVPSQRPGHLAHVSGYTGFQPRCPTANVGSADWVSVRCSAPSRALRQPCARGGREARRPPQRGAKSALTCLRRVMPVHSRPTAAAALALQIAQGEIAGNELPTVDDAAPEAVAAPAPTAL